MDVDKDFLTSCADIPETLGNGAPTGEVIPPAGAQPQEHLFQLTPDMLAVTFDFVFETIADNLGNGAEFWRLKEREKNNLANVWLPVLQSLLDKWGVSGNAPLIFACAMTGMTIVPRLKRDKERRESKRVTTAKARSGDSPSSPDQPVAESPSKPTDSLNDLLGV